MSGAVSVSSLETLLADAGFTDISIGVKKDSKAVIDGWLDGVAAGDFVLSAEIKAVKPFSE